MATRMRTWPATARGKKDIRKVTCDDCDFTLMTANLRIALHEVDTHRCDQPAPKHE